ncbi:MAG: ABC transporter permease [Anderseniella sp.]|jgi:spermidine/putrescine transport system permease protein|nr:ABC transporter permease [Anderseniella sp.]
MAQFQTSSSTAEAVMVRRPNWFGALLQRHEVLRGYSLIMPAFLFMLAGIAIPFAILIIMSFWTTAGFDFNTNLSLTNYEAAVSRPIYAALIGRSMWISALATIATVCVCYPMAYYVAFHVHRNKFLWLILMTLPFWTSYLLRVFAWKIILGYDGMVNATLTGIGLIDAPLEFLLYSPTAVIITLAHAWAAFAILPIYVSLEKIDRSLLEAATDLGDGPVARFLRVTLPLSLPGVFAAMLLIFIPTVGDYITPALLGGPDGMMIGNLIQLQFGRANNWPMGAALAILMMISVTICAAFAWFATRALTSRIA